MELNNGKLIQLLGTLEEKEVKSLIKFAKSPYHNSNKLIISLLQKLLTYYPIFNHKKLTKEHLYHHIHPEGKAYHEGRMNLLMTNLVDVVQRFFMYQELEKDQLLKRRLKSKAFNHRGMYKKYKKEVEGLLDDLEETPFRGEDYFFQKYEIQQEFFFHIETPTGHDGAVYLYNAMDDLDKFYLTAKMNLAAEQITMTKKLNTGTEINLLDSILNFLDKKEMPHSPVIQIYHKFLKLRISGHSETDYKKVKQLFFDNLENIELLKQKLIYFNLVNYIINQINQKKKDFSKELFSLYKLGLNKKYIVNNDTITSVTYSNIAMNSMNLYEFKWSYEFISKYEKFLPKEEAYFTKLMALSHWNFNKGKKENYIYFYNTLKLLREVKASKKNKSLFLISRNLWIRTSYELLKSDPSYFSTLTDYIKNFETQLKKDKILSKEKIQRYFAFVSYVKTLLKIFTKSNFTSHEMKKLKAKIECEEMVISKKWIIEKVEELL